MFSHPHILHGFGTNLILLLRRHSRRLAQAGFLSPHYCEAKGPGVAPPLWPSAPRRGQIPREKPRARTERNGYARAPSGIAAPVRARRTWCDLGLDPRLRGRGGGEVFSRKGRCLCDELADLARL